MCTHCYLSNLRAMLTYMEKELETPNLEALTGGPANLRGDATRPRSQTREARTPSCHSKALAAKQRSLVLAA